MTNQFSHADFTLENATRLSVIIMPRIGKPPLTSFKSLPPSWQTKFNRVMNQYISLNLNNENWESKLLADFNLIVNEDILNENFNPDDTFIPIINTDKELLLTDEQKEFVATLSEKEQLALRV